MPPAKTAAKKPAAKTPAKPATKRTAGTSTNGKAKGFTAAERAAMRDRAKELKETKSRAEAERDLVAAIKKMPKADRVLGEQFHKLVKGTAPDLAPRLWYGMPAYTKEGKVVCFFKAASKFKSRYATIGFEEKANIDDGDAWPVAWAVAKLTPKDEAKFARLVKKAIR
jgi:uncharacterized protein YdhG (YjbR/CyaY superfamily)